jgi:hypothetical protein
MQLKSLNFVGAVLSEYEIDLGKELVAEGFHKRFENLPFASFQRKYSGRSLFQRLVLWAAGQWTLLR